MIKLNNNVSKIQNIKIQKTKNKKIKRRKKMEVEKNIEEKKMILKVSGRIDTITAQDLEKEIESIDENISELVLDLENLEYTSSAGLRVMLKMQKLMNEKSGNMKMIHVSEDVKDVLKITGFMDIMNVE